MARKKNVHAQALTKLRNKKLSKEERMGISRKATQARKLQAAKARLERREEADVNEIPRA